MLTLLIPLMLQIAAVDAPAAAKPEAAATAEPKKICKKEFVTGSKVKKEIVCRSAASREKAQDSMRTYFGGSGNVQPTLPKGIGG